MFKKRWFITLLLPILLAACSGAAAEPEAALPDTAVPPPTKTSTQATEAPAPTEVPMLDLPDLGPAAEFQNDTWLNTDEPITLASLEGKVVLLEFWTFG